ncbi:MAG: hypothetical protein ACQR33_03120 [Candidatus Saccharibacteria bacterium]
MTKLSTLEKNLTDIFVAKAPPLPAKAKQKIVEYLPFLTVIFGVLSAGAAWSLWHWAHIANDLINYANSMEQMYGNNTVAPVSRMSFMVWVGILVLVVEAFLYLSAYQPIKDRKKSGWDLLFYAALVNVAYAIVSLFTNYDGFGSFIGTAITTIIGLYFLFQIRDSYLAKHATTHGTPASEARHSSKK